jgi:hypothetical protein
VTAPASRILLLNPLRGGLLHYEAELESVLVEAGAEVERRNLLEPGAGGPPRRRWLADHARLLRDARRSQADRVIVLWPVLGHVDHVLARWLARRPADIVIHDPRPLVRAVGSGRVAASAARVLAPGVGTIVHSEAAAADLPRGLGPSTLLPHPLFEPVVAARPAEPVVRVLGRFKEGRDLGVLAELARRATDRGWRLEIVGRDWPAVPGWTTRPGFTPEDEFQALVAASSVVVVPYRRFYQSNVAHRALEAAVPVVGPRDSSLARNYAIGSLLVLRARAWRRLGGFDERYPLYGEDADLSARASTAELVTAPLAVPLRHAGNRPIVELPAAQQRLMVEGILRFNRDHRGKTASGIVALALVTGWLARAVAAGVRGRGGLARRRWRLASMAARGALTRTRSLQRWP